MALGWSWLVPWLKSIILLTVPSQREWGGARTQGKLGNQLVIWGISWLSGESTGYLGNQLVIWGISWLSGGRIFPYGTAGSVTEGRKALRSKKRDKL